MNISIDSKNGKTLLTQGKYCAENIVVTPVLEEATVTPSTSAQSVTPGNGKAGLSKVTVGAIETEEKTVTSNGEVTPTSGKYLSKVTVNVPSTPTQEKSVTITENGTTQVTPDSGKALSKVTVVTNVPAKTEEKTITVTENGTTTVTPSSGKDGLSKVTVTTNVPTSVIEEVSTAAAMNALLVAANVGKAYKFTGTTDSTYTNGDIYEVVQV